MDQVIDKKELMDMIDNNVDLLKELIRLYMDNLPKLMSQIKDGVSKKDAALIEHPAHALKGMSYNITAQKIAAAAMTLEKMGRSRELSQAEEMYAILEKEAEILKKVLNEFSQNPS
jgi:two-component system, sensor histidine kinase and response regulator